MASVTYGKRIMENVIMAKIFMANETEPHTGRELSSPLVALYWHVHFFGTRKHLLLALVFKQ